ncbi:uncharacterized protein LOC141719073 [Apium graveolens]|uniref:uncharacterized protein LOC141719073 n=1 Tax=Apium graveolens TaxID=4045 RepID=UPI003D79CB66
MMHDAKDYEKRCDRCQKHAPVVRKPPKMLTSINSPIPFAMLGMYILGTFPMATAQRKFLIVTKWIEAKPLSKITTKHIAQFLSSTSQWTSGSGKSYNSRWAEKRIEKSRNNWVDEILPILWAYRTTCRVTTGVTPFMLAYGAEAVIPVEISHSSPKIQAYNAEENEEGQRLALDLIDEVRDAAHAKIVEY